MKSFLTRVTVGEFSAEGEGNSKKLSKKRAALSILQDLKKLPFIPAVEKPKTHYKKRTKTILKVPPISRASGVMSPREFQTYSPTPFFQDICARPTVGQSKHGRYYRDGPTAFCLFHNKERRLGISSAAIKLVPLQLEPRVKRDSGSFSVNLLQIRIFCVWLSPVTHVQRCCIIQRALGACIARCFS